MLNFSEIKCVGCTACASACPQNIIQMQRDHEGFLYPFVANSEACTECNLCISVCPVLNFQEEIPFPQKGLIAQITDEKIRRESASGGMFSAIALSVLAENGIVYGAAYNDAFQVCHIGISDKADLWKLRHSKYVQSDLNGVMREVKKHLVSGRMVCFSGTPCQIEGLQHYLKKDYANLLLVDVVCHGVSSPLVWEKYLETAKEYHPQKIFFRWKHYGYKYSTMSMFDETDSEVYHAGVESDKMLRAYFSNSCARKTCYECLFKKRYRTSDFTIWDFFQPRFFNKDFDDDRGTSGVLVHSEKASRQLEKILQAKLIKYQFVSPDELTFGNNEMVRSVPRGAKRDAFLRDASQMSGEELFQKHFPDTWQVRIKKHLRLFLVRTGLYSLVKYRLFLYRRNHAKK